MVLRLEDKLELYRRGRYAFEPPPVCHLMWSILDWIRWIDSHGKWLPYDTAA